MAAKRIRLEIMADILSLCMRPQTKTRVMYMTNLSYRALQNYLAQLQSLKLLEVHHSITKYSTTARGQEFLEKWTELKSLLSPMGVPTREDTL